MRKIKVKTDALISLLKACSSSPKIMKQSSIQFTFGLHPRVYLPYPFEVGSYPLDR